MGEMGMHGWMACLQQMALVPGLDQQTPSLAQSLLDFLLITYKIKHKHGKTYNHQSPNNVTQTTSHLSCFRCVWVVWAGWGQLTSFSWLFTCVGDTISSLIRP